MRGLAAAVGLALLVLCAFVSPAQAQRSEVLAVSAESVARRLEAQHRAAIIRERRQADDRELRLIAAAEMRMRAARQALSSAQGNRAAAESALEAARAEYVRLVEAVPLRDATTQIEMEAFRAELEGRLPEATPALIAAYEEFADGDRAAAWATLEPLIRARAQARMAAARAVAASEVRQLAELREIMRVNGEATAADVLALWNQAAALDASDAWTHVARARLALFTNQPALAREAAEAALATAQTPRMRTLALDELAKTLREQNDLNGALARVTESLRISRELYAEDPGDLKNLHNIVAGLAFVADVMRDLGDLNGALRHYDEALQAMRELQARAPDDPTHVRGMTAVLQRRGDTLSVLGDADGALAQYREALQIAAALHEASPADENLARDHGVMLGKIGYALMARNDVSGALTHFEAALRITEALYARDRSNAPLAYDHADVLVGLGRAWFALEDFDASARHHERAVHVYRVLHEGDRSAFASAWKLSWALQNRGAALRRLGDHAGARRDWTEAAALIERLQAGPGGDHPEVANQLAWTRNELAALPAE